MEYTIYSKDYGLLTKEIRLENGEIIKDSSQCRMANGAVQTVAVSNLLELAESLKNLTSSQAIGLGVPRIRSEKALRIVKKGLEAEISISRTRDCVHYEELKPAFALLDYDPEKGKTALSIDEVRAYLIGLVPALKDCEMLALSSTSSGVYKESEPQPKALNGGIHYYIAVDDGSKIPELGKIIAEKCWLQGLGRFDSSKSGTLLSRTLFDEAVYSPERLIFEAPPVLGVGLKQLPRMVRHWQGGILKASDIRGLTTSELSRVETLKLEAKALKQPEADIVKAASNKKDVDRLIKTGINKHVALEQVTRANNGILTGGLDLHFAGLPVVTVTDVLRDPASFDGWELADIDDPLNGQYRSKLYKNETGLKIHTFKGGGGNYTIDKVEIKLDMDNPTVVFEHIESALNTGTRPDVFKRAGLLCQTGRDGVIRILTTALIAVSVSRLVRFYRPKNVKGEWIRERVEVPDRLWKAFLEKGDWSIPELLGITDAPYLVDGEVIQTAGYNFNSKLYLSREFDFCIPKKPTRVQAGTALTYLRKILSGFPFASPVDEAVALAMMLTAIQRPTLETAPAFAPTANAPGVGKTQLGLGVVSISTGSTPVVHAYRDNEQEFSKMLTSVLIQGKSYLIIDNVKLGVALGGDALCTLLTSSVFGDRLLGVSRIIEMPTRILIVATGNNLKLSSDITRRCLMVYLDARCERPELREFDKSFIQICKDEREPILKAILTILKAYHTAERPKVDNVRLGTFEQFSDDICKPLVWLGVVDPVLGLAKASADEGIAGLGELLQIWAFEVFDKRVTTQELLTHPGVSEWFRSEFDDKGGLNVRKVGRFLSKYAGRVLDGMRVIQDGTLHKVTVWRLETV
ncbi:hypothetical protein [Methylobacter sp. S3L5C]|uniref:hypothetical protein n=1 Tax=Methylobacter sp. S3L5C TaxID=2839024 RepID=UPI001FADF7A9|nr:hypothetical protein [Methylobacter sp. S3L5C]UOA10263.1 hypothetical protein KKZ03_08540 [Methylobacter sp. S3L5C]